MSRMTLDELATPEPPPPKKKRGRPPGKYGPARDKTRRARMLGGMLDLTPEQLDRIEGNLHEQAWEMQGLSRLDRKAQEKLFVDSVKVLHSYVTRARSCNPQVRVSAAKTLIEVTGRIRAADTKRELELMLAQQQGSAGQLTPEKVAEYLRNVTAAELDKLLGRADEMRRTPPPMPVLQIVGGSE